MSRFDKVRERKTNVLKERKHKRKDLTSKIKNAIKEGRLKFCPEFKTQRVKVKW